MAIFSLWRDTMDCPGPKLWSGQHGTIYNIIERLGMSKGSYKTVRKVLEDVWDCHINDVKYVGTSRQVGCAPHHQPMILPGSVEEQIVADAVEGNVGFTGAMHLVNSHIKAVDVTSPHVGRSSIKTVVDRLRPKISPISATSQGSTLSPESPLGRARYEQLQQHRLRMGRVRLEDLPVEDQRKPAFLNLDDYSYSVNQVSFWDEMHPSCRIGGRGPGPQSKTQMQFLRDINTGKLVDPTEPLAGINGNYDSPDTWTRVKFNKEIRLCLGCCLGKDSDGVVYGKRLEPFDYTNRWVVTISQYLDECVPRQLHKIKTKGPRKGWLEGERTPDDGIYDNDPVSVIKGIGPGKVKILAHMGVKTVKQVARMRSARVNALIRKRGITEVKVLEWIESAKSANPGSFDRNIIDHRLTSNPYQSRYGDEWERHLREDIRKSGSVCITELILHMCKATAKAFENTEYRDSWFFYHDALSQLTCSRTREWMAEKDLLKRWLLPVGPCNEGTCYFGRPVGNSPEIMPWDCSLNHDVHCCVEFYSAICKWIPEDHPLYPQRFSKSSTKVMLRSYLRILDPDTGVCPSSDRIVQDIGKAWGDHLDMICGKNGGAVPGIGNRVGRRKLEGVKKRGGKRVKGEWKMLDNLHPDILGPWEAFIERSRARHGAC